MRKGTGRGDSTRRLILSPETLACLLLAYPLRWKLNEMGLTQLRAPQIDLFFILLLIVAVFFAGHRIRRALRLRTLLHDEEE